MRSAGSHLDFDLTLAAQQSNDNPVYYVQYAYARICSILRLLGEDGVSVKDYSEINPSLLKEESELNLLKSSVTFRMRSECRQRALNRQESPVILWSLLPTSTHSIIPVV